MIQNNSCTISRTSKILLLFFLLSTIVLIGFFRAFGTAKRTAVVSTTSGPVQGSILTTHNSVEYAAFKGIPYAKPPVGNLRFKPPSNPDSWTEVYSATTDAPDCIQSNPDTWTTVGDEDCLYINVATPDLIKAPTKLKSVMVWIYGGAYIGGSSTFTAFTPDNIVEKDMVYVSLNYRSGAFGYLSLNHPNASGNAGLKDLVHGLKWVQKNIATFGGNPKNVTIMGHSSGAASVGYLVLSNSAAGLFHASISMNAAPLNPWAFQNTTECLRQAHRLTDNLGIKWTNPDSILKDLYDVPASEIVNATVPIAKQSFAPFGPTLENASIAIEPVLTECIVTKYHTGRFNQIPQIIGYDDQETVFFVSMPTVTELIIENYIAATKMYDMDVPESVSIAKKQLDQNNMTYFVDPHNKELWKFINETSGVLFIGGIDQTQRFLAANNKNYPVYYYRISFYSGEPHAPAWNNSLPGAGHTDVLSFIFYNPIMNYSTNPATPVGRTIKNMVEMWTNFAKYGHPTPNWIPEGYSLGITWPDSGLSGITLEIGNELTIKPRLVTDVMHRYENSSWKYLSETTECDCNSNIIFTVPLETIP